MEIKNHKTKGIATLWLIVAGFVLIAGSGLWWFIDFSIDAIGRGDLPYVEPGKCPDGVKLCTDGYAVRRTGPRCEFAACPQLSTSDIHSLDTSTWKTYRNEKYGFEIRYPADWLVQSEMSLNYPVTMIANKSKTENAHGVGYPPAGSWVEVAKSICNEPKNDFIDIGPKPDIWEKVICKSGFQISLGYWPSDSKRDDKAEAVLNNILSTFKFIK